MNVMAATASDFVNQNSYNNMYPAMNNKMRTRLSSGESPPFAQNPVSTLMRTNTDSARQVVARGGTSVARSASNNTTGISKTNIARSGTTPQTGNSSARRVVSRNNGATVARSARGDSSQLNSIRSGDAATPHNNVTLSSSRCLADYTECMNGFCKREKTAYNRCYCSVRLAQIDAQYQPAIDSLIKQILALQGGNTWTENEMNDYWEEMVGQHTGNNSWENLDNALDINWADTESRVRGQQAFITGHEYCAQHLRGCFYMADNMRDAYRSEIARDCASYESSLQRIKSVAENMIDNYN